MVGPRWSATVGIDKGVAEGCRRGGCGAAVRQGPDRWWVEMAGDGDYLAGASMRVAELRGESGKEQIDYGRDGRRREIKEFQLLAA
ncbi:unnamed protein product [Linum trigynum]|uniref:Uncharacterized protein n=1 Tax=Linum trigynum TaxID=586398 RepID=A0AAV2DAD5_9ROSI